MQRLLKGSLLRERDCYRILFFIIFVALLKSRAIVSSLGNGIRLNKEVPVLLQYCVNVVKLISLKSRYIYRFKI